MAVALSLAELRAKNPTEVKRAPSLLHTAADATKIPLAEQAALAANSLNLLASIDAELPDFISPLYLDRPTTRQTLDSSAQTALSNASIDLVRRLSPLFPVRHAQRVLEWLVNALHAALLAPEPEIDAMLVAALPYHATPQFPTFVAALLFARPLPRWQWLMPVAEQRLPARSDFLVAKCPPAVHALAIDWAVSLVNRAIPANAASSFLASVTARWIISTTPSHRRTVVLKALIAVEDAIILPAQQNADLISAALAIAAAAIVAGIDDDVAPVMGRCLCKAIRKCEGDIPASTMTCLFLLVKRYGENSLNPSTGLRLFRSDVGGLVQTVGVKAKRLFGTAFLCAVPDGFPKPGSLRSLKEVADTHGDRFLTENIVKKTVARLLDRMCIVQDSGESSGSVNNMTDDFKEALKQLLSPWAKGRFSTAVEDGIRLHYEARSEKRDDMKPVYTAVDNILLQALQGTAYAASRRKSHDDMGQLSGTVLLTVLSHPSEHIRYNALMQVIDSGVPEDEELAIKQRLTSMIETEVAADVLAKACDAARKVSACSDKERFRLYTRSTSRLLGSSKVTPKNSAHLVREFLLCCLSIVKTDPEAVLAGIVGFTIGGLINGKLPGVQLKRLRKLASSVLRKDPLKPLFDKHISSFTEGADLATLIQRFVAPVVRASIIRLDTFFDELRLLGHQWSLTVLGYWAAFLENESVLNLMPLPETSVAALSHAVQSTLEFFPVDQMEPTIVSTCKVLFSCELENREKVDHAKLLWKAAVITENERVIQLILKQLLANIGEQKTASLLGSVCMSSKHHKVSSITLMWYFHLAREIAEGAFNDNFASVMLNAMFGSDDKLRAQATRLLTEQASSLGEKETPSLTALQKHVTSKLPTSTEITEKPDGANVVSSNLQKSLLLAQHNIRHLPAPLSMSQAPKAHIAFLTDEISKQYERRALFFENIALLRATQGLSLPSSDFLKYAIGTLKTLTFQLTSTKQPSDEDVEKFALLSLSMSISVSKFGTKKLERHLGDILSKAVDLLKMVDDEDWGHTQHRDLIHVCAIAHLSIVLQGGSPPSRKEALIHLLVQASRSSDGAVVARRVIDVSLGKDVSLNLLMAPLKHMNRFFNDDQKRLRTPSDNDVSPSPQDVNLGALETIVRWVRVSSTEKEGLSRVVETLEGILWKFVTKTMEEAKKDDVIIEEDMEYRLHLALEALCGLHRLDSQEQTSENTSINIEALIDATFYPHRDAQITETAIVTGVRRTALELVGALAPLRSEDLLSVAEPLIANLVLAKNTSRSFRALRGIVPCLLLSSCPFPKLMGWLASAGYAKAIAQKERDEIRHLMASSIKASQNQLQNVQLCMKTIHKQFKNGGAEDIASECSQLLEETGVDVFGTFTAILKSPEKFRSELAVTVLLRDSFQAMLASTLENGPSEKLKTILSKMYIALLQCESTPTNQRAVENTVALLPLEGLSTCTVACLAHREHQVRLGGLKALSSRLQEDESPIRASWSLSGISMVDERDAKSEQSALVAKTGEILCSTLRHSLQEPQDLGLLREEAATALTCLVIQFGETNTKAVLKYAHNILEFSHDLMTRVRSTKSKKGDPLRALLAQYLNCLASFVSTLRSKAIAFIPASVDLSLSVMRNTFLGKDGQLQGISMKYVVKTTEAAVRLCTSVVESAPSLFGQRYLKTLASVGVASSSPVVEDLLKLAIQKVPSATGIGALVNAADELNTSQAVPAGVQLLLNVVKRAADSFSKAQVKMYASDMVTIVLKCVMHNRESEDLVQALNGDAPQAENSEDGSEGQDNFEDWMLDGKDVDDSAAEAISSLVLRLPETEFKKLFETLDAWGNKYEAPREVEAVLPEKDSDSLRNVPRALPFFRICGRLFQELQSIFVPYFFLLLDKALAPISFMKKELIKAKSESDSETKKRKRGQVEEEEENGLLERYCGLCEKTQDTALECVSQMLRQDNCTAMLTGEAVSRVQGAVLTYFDERDGESEKVARCLSALASRIVAMGDEAETKDESRSLLSAMARELLLHTQDTRVSVRKGALAVSEGIARAIGDEYLVTLPESMPVLSEVIDDESDAVQKAAKSFAEVMGSLAGEPILEQLK